MLSVDGDEAVADNFKHGKSNGCAVYTDIVFAVKGNFTAYHQLSVLGIYARGFEYFCTGFLTHGYKRRDPGLCLTVSDNIF